MEISKELFETYLRIQIEGKFNMNDRKTIADLCSCTCSDISVIQANYKELNQKYPGLREQIEEEIMREKFFEDDEY